MTVRHVTASVIIGFGVSLLLLACGSAESTRVRSKRVDRSARNTSATGEIGIGISRSPAINSPDETALKPLKARGDAFFGVDDIIYRGATAGLVIGRFEENTSKWTEIGTLALPGVVNDVFVLKDVAYLACGPDGVAVVDVSNPSAPSHHATIDTLGAALRLDVDSNTLVVADGAMGLVVLDIESPLNPKVVSLWASSGYVRDVVISKRRIYVAEDRVGVSSLKLRLNGHMETQWRYPTRAQARSVSLDENQRLFVANGPGGVLLLDVSKRKKPKELGRLNFSDTVRDVAMVTANDRLYVANGDNGLVVVDTSNAADMKVSGEFVPKSPVNRVYPEGTRLFLGNDSGGLVLLDISDPDVPKIP